MDELDRRHFAPLRPDMSSRFGSLLRSALLGSRWLMAPLCVGLIGALLIIIAQFFREVAHAVTGFPAMDRTLVVLAVLHLVDLVLIGNLVLMIIAAGVGIYLPQSDREEQRPGHTAFIDLAGLKLRVVASISAIAAVHLLEELLNIDATDGRGLLWDILTLLAFGVSGLLLAAMDRLAERK